MDPNSSFTSKNIQLNTFSCSTNLWRLFTEYEPLKVIHGYTTKRPFSGFAGFPICRENGGGEEIPPFESFTKSPRPYFSEKF